MRIVHRVLVLVPGVVTACSHPQGDATPSAKPPVIDRFSAAAGHLMVRDSAHPLPSPDQPIDLDHPPFITQGLAAELVGEQAPLGYPRERAERPPDAGERRDRSAGGAGEKRRG